MTKELVTREEYDRFCHEVRNNTIAAQTLVWLIQQHIMELDTYLLPQLDSKLKKLDKSMREMRFGNTKGKAE